MLPVALGTFVFDAVIENPDRRPGNPNCLIAGQDIRLIDHELAFPQRSVGESACRGISVGCSGWTTDAGTSFYMS